MSKQTQREVWLDHNSFASTLVTLFIDTYGVEALEWDPATMLLEIEEDWQLALPVLAFDKLQAGITLLTTDSFFKSLPDFINLCNVLSGSPTNPELWDPATPLEIAWGITEALFLSPPEAHDTEPFTAEILAYIGAALREEGIMKPPDVLRIGTHNPHALENVQHEFSDDPDMFQAIYEVETGRGQDIDETVRHQLRLLVTQISQLPLVHGDAQAIFKGKNAYEHSGKAEEEK